MPLSKTSRQKLQTCHSDLVKLIEAVAETEKAVDVVPVPLNWEDIPAFEKLGEKIMAKAKELGISIRWGRDFTNLKDYPHFELMEKEKNV